MNSMYKPNGFSTITPNMIVKDVAKAVEFYTKVFGAEEVLRLKMPGGTVAHCELTIGDSRLNLGEAMAGWPEQPLLAQIHVTDSDATFALAIQEGAKELSPVQDMFFGSREGRVMDPFGNSWVIATQTKVVSAEDMQRFLDMLPTSQEPGHQESAPALRPGALGAMMDEYERAIREFSLALEGLTQASYERVREPAGTDEDTRSIQAVARHVLRSGHGYTAHMRKALALPFQVPELAVETPQDAVAQLALLATRTAETFEGSWAMPDPMIEGTMIQAHWGPTFNLEQMFEHAIVHVLRHRRQVERFLR